MAQINPLARWFTETGVTQQSLAEAAGVPQSEISKYANSRRRPNVKTAFRLERATKSLSGKGVRHVRAEEWGDVEIDRAPREQPAKAAG